MYNPKSSTLLWVIIAVLAVAGIVYLTTQKLGGEVLSDEIAVEKMEILGETLKIGLIMPMTGDAAVYGKNESRAAAITTAGDFVFRTVPSDALAGQIAVDYAYQDIGF